jgi:electron transfer flavoprotein alpha subunit
MFKRALSTLVLVEHKQGKIVSSTLNTISASLKLSPSLSCLVAGDSNEQTDAVAKAVSSYCQNVLVAKSPSLANGLPEAFAPLIVQLAKSKGFTHILSSHSAFGKNILPRAAALLDVAQVSDVTAIESPDTFQRPIYAGMFFYSRKGNAIAKVKSSDAIKLLTIRSTAFPAASAGASASVENVTVDSATISSKWINEAIAKSDRPELGSAKIVIGGGRVSIFQVDLFRD